ncbi:MAG TPA: NAD-dependent epimerase/dehydratase family protein, partial [Acidimicrobiales bacterium]|nr:NAD-dependent epimerase/dehydratase family protein [Acidimicrobiales bacterium]
MLGATGSVGTSALRSLLSDRRVDRVVGVARRPPVGDPFGVEWHESDVTTDDLVGLFRGADAVVHLAWVLSPARNARALHRVNVEGTRRILEAVAAAEVHALVYVSSVGAYSPAPGRRVDESHPTDGVPGSTYSAQKSAIERLLDRFEAEHPIFRVVRLRPALVLKAEAAKELRALFVGHRRLTRLLSRGRLPVLPCPRGLALQVVHGDDVGDAVRRTVTAQAAGAYNVAAEPILGPADLAAAVGGRPLLVPARPLRSAARAAFALHLEPSEPGWLDLAVQAPLLSTARIREELGWEPRHSATEVLREFVEGLAEDRAGPTPRARAPDAGQVT